MLLSWGRRGAFSGYGRATYPITLHFLLPAPRLTRGLITEGELCRWVAAERLRLFKVVNATQRVQHSEAKQTGSDRT